MYDVADRDVRTFWPPPQRVLAAAVSFSALIGVDLPFGASIFSDMPGYNFTEDVRRTLYSSREQAALLGHEYVDTEHFLLALIDDEGSIAADVLKILNVDAAQMRQMIEETFKSRPALPLELTLATPRGRRRCSTLR